MEREGTFIINVKSKHHQVRSACDITFIHFDCTKIIYTCNLSCVILGADYIKTPFFFRVPFRQYYGLLYALCTS